MITIIDYGVGNLFSLSSSLSYLGLENKVSRDPEDLRKADHIILPGVGAYGDAIAKLRGSGMAEPLLDEAKAGKPIMGICLGMQLLFDKSSGSGTDSGRDGRLKRRHSGKPKSAAHGLEQPASDGKRKETSTV